MNKVVGECSPAMPGTYSLFESYVYPASQPNKYILEQKNKKKIENRREENWPRQYSPPPSMGLSWLDDVELLLQRGRRVFRRDRSR